MGSLGNQSEPLIDKTSPDGVPPGKLKYMLNEDGITPESSVEEDKSGKFQTSSYMRGKYDEFFPGGYCVEFKKSMRLGIPLMFVFFTQIVLQPLSLLFGGHLGTLQLGVLGLANSIISVTGNYFFLGMSTACDTLYSQITGYKNMKYLGIMLQRSMVIFWLTVLLVMGLDMNMATLLAALGQDEAVAILTGRYLTIFLPGLPSFFVMKVYRNYTCVQGEIASFFVSGVFNLVLAIFLNWLFVIYLEWGLDGSSLAQMISYVATCILYTVFIIVYSTCIPRFKDAWPGWSWRLFENWGEFTNLAIHGIFMICLEMWAFEISIFLAGLLGPVEMAAQALVVNVDIIFYGIPAGIGTAAAIRIGQSLGAGNGWEAKCATYVALTLVACTSIVTTTLFATLRYELPKLFSDDPEVIELSAQLLPYVAYYNIFMNVSIVMRGVLRGMGKQVVGSVIIIIGYYVMGLPIGISLMFLTPLKTAGFWLGCCIALTIDTLIYLWYLVRMTDWPQLIVDARERASRLGASSSEQEKEEQAATLLTEMHSPPATPIPMNTTTFEIDDGLLDAKMPTKLKIKRGLTIFLILAIFVGCILCRVYIPDPVVDLATSDWADVIIESLNITVW